MIWLSGQLGVVLDAQRRWDLGVMCQPGSTAPPQLAKIRQTGLYWAADNAVFGGKFDPVRWEAWLRAVPRATRLTCLFAVAPDVLHRDERGNVYGDPEATLARSREYIPLLRDLAYRVAFVAQDGATPDLIPWDEIDALFVGGSDAWKFADRSVALLREAQDRGLWTHMGRCQARGGAGGRMAAAHALGIDSADGTVLKHDPSRLPRIVRGLEATNAQTVMEVAS